MVEPKGLLEKDQDRAYTKDMNNLVTATKIDPTSTGQYNVLVKLPDGWLYVGTSRTLAAAKRKASAWMAAK